MNHRFGISRSPRGFLVFASPLLLALSGLAAAFVGCTKNAAKEEAAPQTTAAFAEVPRTQEQEAAEPKPADERNGPSGGRYGEGKGAAGSKPPSPAYAPDKRKNRPLDGDLSGFDTTPGAPNTKTPSMAQQGEQTVTAPAPGEAPIDPNGRFATTYRPGGGHLSAFESAVARGIVPAAEREVVSDVGARYAAQVDAPKGKALALVSDFERSSLPPSGGPVHLRLTLKGTDDAPKGRPHLSVHLVLDLSGSMRGESMQRAREAASALVDKLAPTDDFSLVTFSSDADVRIPDGPVGPRRDSMKKTIAGLEEGGGTNIGKGLELGYAQANSKGIPGDAVKVVLLLSDGRANSGITNSHRLARMALDAFQNGIQTSSFGLGTDYDGELMSSIARDGAGGYYYMRDPDQIGSSLSSELDKRLDPVATAVEVRVRLKPGVQLLRVYGSRRLTAGEAQTVRTIEVAADQQAQKRDGIKTDRQDDTEGGMRFFIPAFTKSDSHALLLKLNLPAGAQKRDLALIELKYKDRVSKKNVADEFPLSIQYAGSDAESAQSQNASVLRTVQGFAAGEALSDAASMIARGQRDQAAALLSEREEILRKAAETLSEPLFLKDADRLARLRSFSGNTTGLGDPLVLAMLLETAALGHLR